MIAQVKGTLTINNMPRDTFKYKYIIAKAVEGQIWYFGADDDQSRAEEVAKANDGFVILNISLIYGLTD